MILHGEYASTLLSRIYEIECGQEHREIMYIQADGSTVFDRREDCELRENHDVDSWLGDTMMSIFYFGCIQKSYIDLPARSIHDNMEHRINKLFAFYYHLHTETLFENATDTGRMQNMIAQLRMFSNMYHVEVLFHADMPMNFVILRGSSRNRKYCENATAVYLSTGIWQTSTLCVNHATVPDILWMKELTAGELLKKEQKQILIAFSHELSAMNVDILRKCGHTVIAV